MKVMVVNWRGETYLKYPVQIEKKHNELSKIQKKIRGEEKQKNKTNDEKKTSRN